MSNRLSANSLTANSGGSRAPGKLSPAARAKLAATVAVLFAHGRIQGAEREAAISVLEALARDLELDVREALSRHVKHCPYLPRSIAQTLAGDLDSVALPIVRHSPVLSETDLLEIVREGGQTLRLAVALRDAVSIRLSDALVETENKEVVSALLDNTGAEIGSTSLDRILKRFGADEKVQALIVERPTLPLEIITRIIGRLGDALRQRITERHDIPEVLVGRLVTQSRERALVGTVETTAISGAVEALAQRLHAEGALTPTFLLRALCRGQLSLFSAGIAIHAGVPASEARALINASTREGLAKLYANTELPRDLFAAFRIALDVAQDVAPKEPTDWAESHTYRIIQRLIATYESVAPGDLDSVLFQLARLADRRSGSAGRCQTSAATQLPQPGVPVY